MDYWSNFLEVAEIHRKPVQAGITQFNLIFAPIPEVLVTDNGPEFGNQEIKSFSSIGTSITELQAQDINKGMERANAL